MSERVILHADLNNFYASVACKDYPNLLDMPVAVCGDSSIRHGIVLSKNNKAKAMGVKTGQVIWEAKQRCPSLITAKANFFEYLKYSKLVRDIFSRYTSHIQPFGIDEAWIDLSDDVKDIDYGESVANHIRNTIRNELGISVSIGVSNNKIYAKFGSDIRKPDAVSVITSKKNINLLFEKPVKELIFIGSSTEKKLNQIGIFNIGQLAEAPVNTLYNTLGKNGLMLSAFARGKDSSSVLLYGSALDIKSIGNGITTAHDLKSYDDASITLYALCESISQRLRSHKYNASCIKLTIRYISLVTRQFQMQTKIKSDISYDLYRFSIKLLEDNWDGITPLRSISIAVSNLGDSSEPFQLSFLSEEIIREKYRNLELSIDKIREKFGHFSLQRAVMLCDKQLGQINPLQEHVIHPDNFSF